MSTIGADWSMSATSVCRGTFASITHMNNPGSFLFMLFFYCCPRQLSQGKFQDGAVTDR
jgi:hypothetical protein